MKFLSISLLILSLTLSGCHLMSPKESYYNNPINIQQPTIEDTQEYEQNSSFNKDSFIWETFSN